MWLDHCSLRLHPSSGLSESFVIRHPICERSLHRTRSSPGAVQKESHPSHSLQCSRRVDVEEDRCLLRRFLRLLALLFLVGVLHSHTCASIRLDEFHAGCVHDEHAFTTATSFPALWHAYTNVIRQALIPPHHQNRVGVLNDLKRITDVGQVEPSVLALAIGLRCRPDRDVQFLRQLAKLFCYETVRLVKVQ